MWTVSEWITLSLLAIISIEDIKKRTISARMISASFVAVLIYRIFVEPVDIWLLIGGIVTGVVFLIISRVTEEGIGYGDSLGILVLGIYMGLWRLLCVLSISFFLLLCITIPVLWRRKMSKKVRFPFFPFLAGGYLLFLLTGGMEV